MTALLTPSEVGEVLRVRDRRTVRRRLAELGVPVIPAGRSYLVRAVDLDRSVAASVVPATGDVSPVTRHGRHLAPRVRLWDDGRANQVSPRRANARARGTGGETPDASESVPGSNDRFSGPSPRAQTRQEGKQ